MKTKAQLIKELYSTGHSRCLDPNWLQRMLTAINNAPS